jgi:hypothetical protein
VWVARINQLSEALHIGIGGQKARWSAEKPCNSESTQEPIHFERTLKKPARTGYISIALIILKEIVSHSQDPQKWFRNLGTQCGLISRLVSLAYLDL